MNKNKRMPVGVDDFRELRKGYYFVDKTNFIRDIIENRGKVTLITRPRRFGKTLTMSMLYYFFANENAEENRALFEGCAIAEAGEEYMAEQGTRPVVFFSLKDAKTDTYESLMALMKALLQRLYLNFRHILEGPALDESEKALFRSVKDMTADRDYMQTAVQNLTMYLSKYYRRPAILLIDEYDAPIQSAWEHGYYDKAIVFFRNFLGSALKSNPALDFAVLTGVTRISKESIFSALNNLKVSSVIQGVYSDVFGFTPGEVKQMAEDLGYGDKLGEIREWYDGYNFSGYEIYNPWSVVRYFDEGCRPSAYWVNTSGNGILTEMLECADARQAEELSALLHMDTLDTPVWDAVVYDDIRTNRAALYTMLLTAGYLKKVPGVLDQMEGYCTVAIPNQEIRTVYASEVLSKLNRTNPLISAKILKSLLTGQGENFAKELSVFLENIASYYDTANKESFYHGFMMGMLALLTPGRYAVKSNRESGYGRFDLAVFPKRSEDTGIILELKVSDKESDMENDAKAALGQIEKMDYGAEFREKGINTVWKYGVAFWGKKTRIVMG